METLDQSPAAGDLVWAPLGSRKWWPARAVPDPSASLVAVSYFGSAAGGAAVCDAALLRSFSAESEFKKIVGRGGGRHRQSDGPSFAAAVEAALEELGRRLEVRCCGAGTEAEVSWMQAEFLRRLRSLARGATASSALEAALIRGWASAFHRREGTGSRVHIEDDVREVEVPVGVGCPARGPGDGEDSNRKNKEERVIADILASLDKAADGQEGGSKTPMPSKPKRAPPREPISPVPEEKRSEGLLLPEEKRSGGREGVETGVGRRERRKSKYLSPPYTIVGSTGFSKATKFSRSIEETSQESKRNGDENKDASVGEILAVFRAMASDPLHYLGDLHLHHDGGGGAVRDLFGTFRSSVYMGENKRKDDTEQGNGDGTHDRKNEKSLMTPEVVKLRGCSTKNLDNGESGNVEGGKPNGSEGTTSLVGREAEASGSDKGEEGDGRTPKSRKRKPLDVEGGKPRGSGRTILVGREAEASGPNKGEKSHGRTPKSRKRKPLDVEEEKHSDSGRTSLVGTDAEVSCSDKGEEGRGRTLKSRKKKPLDVEGEKPSDSGRIILVGREAEISGSDKGEEGRGRTPKSRKRKPLDVEGGKPSDSGRIILVGREAEISGSDKGEEGCGRTPKSRKKKYLDVEGGKPSGSGRTILVGREAEISGSDKGKEGHGRTPKSRKRSDVRNAGHSEERILDNSQKSVPVGKKVKASGSNENQSNDGASLAGAQKMSDNQKADDSPGSRHHRGISEKQQSHAAGKEKPNGNRKPAYVKSEAKAYVHDKDKSDDGKSRAGREQTSLTHEVDGPEGSKSKRRQKKNSENAERVGSGEGNMDSIENAVADAKESESKASDSEEGKTDDEIKKRKGAAAPPVPPLQFIKRNLKRMVKMLNRYPASTGEGVESAEELMPEVRDKLVVEVSGLLQKVKLLTGGGTSAASGGNG